MAFPDALNSVPSESVRVYVLLRPGPPFGSHSIRHSDVGCNDRGILYELPSTVD
jgi:hypothetical protein